MEQLRASGVLLHPGSLPGPGIGALGESAHRFIDILRESGQKIWQVLPLNPVGVGYSPYQSPSAFACNPLFIDLKALYSEGLSGDVSIPDTFYINSINYPAVIRYKNQLLKAAFQRFHRDRMQTTEAYREFIAENTFWLLDYAVFMVLKSKYRGKIWTTWDPEHRQYSRGLIERIYRQNRSEVDYYLFEQYCFFTQWRKLKAHANAAGVEIIGDVPFYVAHDSVDVWKHRRNFKVNSDGSLPVVAGVPPDYFSPTGQRWGNPLYHWKHQAQDGYRWWKNRIKTVLKYVDTIRIDHFRGFEKSYEIPGESRTAEHGRWVRGPGAGFFRALGELVNSSNVIAEDLGLITPAVEKLRDTFHFPGIRVLQFAFDGNADNPHLPHNYTRNCVVYSGTHDNDTTAGWIRKSKLQKNTGIYAYLKRYCGCANRCDPWDVIRIGLGSVANRAIFPAQDILSLGSRARMNFPGTSKGNWRWKLDSLELLREPMARLGELSLSFGRC